MLLHFLSKHFQFSIKSLNHFIYECFSLVKKSCNVSIKAFSRYICLKCKQFHFYIVMSVTNSISSKNTSLLIITKGLFRLFLFLSPVIYLKMFSNFQNIVPPLCMILIEETFISAEFLSFD